MQKPASASPKRCFTTQGDAIPPSYLGIVKQLVCAARSCLEHGKELPSTAFICNSRTMTFTAVPIDSIDMPRKEMAAQAIKDAAGKMNADCIITVMDAWVRHHDTVASYRAEIAQYGGLANNPNAISSVAVTIEIHNGVWMATMPIIPLGGHSTKRTFERLTFIHMDHSHGRFCGLLTPLH